MKSILSSFFITLVILMCSCKDNSASVKKTINHAIVGKWEYVEGKSVNTFELNPDQTITWVYTFKGVDSKFSGIWEIKNNLISAKFGDVSDNKGTFQVTTKLKLKIVKIENKQATILWLDEGEGDEKQIWKRIK